MTTDTCPRLITRCTQKRVQYLKVEKQTRLRGGFEAGGHGVNAAERWIVLIVSWGQHLPDLPRTSADLQLIDCKTKPLPGLWTR